MAQESQLAHRVLSNLALPYITNISPASTDPHYVSGSTDILTSINSYAERRPGFATNVETTPTVFNNLQRLFAWDRFDGTFIEMACDVNSSGFAQVFKRVVGIDASFISIFTDTVPASFDFVVSNNTVYFSNGHVAKKWDPINGISNWGISIGAASTSTGPNAPTAAANVAGFATPWTNPTNVELQDGAFAIRTVPGGSSGQELDATTFGFAVAAGTTITGILVEVKGQSSTGATCVVNLLKGGFAVGTSRSASYPASNGFMSFGGSGDLWGTTWVPNDINQTNFGVAIEALLNFTPNPDNQQVDFIRVTVYGFVAPIIAVAGGAGTFTATAGYQYVFCYGNSVTGHISSPTPVSVSTGIFTNKLNVSITLTASTDAQVNQIRLFRTTDGGGGTYFELPTSPYANSSGAVLDTAADATLQVGSIAPTPTFNDPPTPLFSPVYFSGRIWGFAGNKVYFSGLEEINQGVPEESFPSGVAGNFWSFDEPVQGLGVAGVGAGQTLGILCGGRLYGIQGNTLDTFRRFLVSNRRGCRNRTCVTSLGGMMAWLDSSNQVWATDGNTLQELSTAIRNDLTAINQANCSMTFHTAGRFHWLVLSTGTKLYVYDVDQDQFMPPWTFAAQYVVSEEVSAGNYVLQAATVTKALQMSTTAFNDNGVTYQPVAQFGLLSIIPDYGSRFSYIGVGSYNEPTRTGYPVIFQLTNNAKSIQDFLICNDDDPTLATYTSIINNLQDTSTTFNRTNGTSMTQLVFPTTAPAARWIGMKIVLLNADQGDKLYELFMGYKPLGGR